MRSRISDGPMLILIFGAILIGHYFGEMVLGEGPHRIVVTQEQLDISECVQKSERITEDNDQLLESYLRLKKVCDEDQDAGWFVIFMNWIAIVVGFSLGYMLGKRTGTIEAERDAARKTGSNE